MKFRKKKKQELSVIDSITIDDNFSSKSENRIFTLLLKSLIIYLVTAGMIGSALTATNTYFNQLIFNITIFSLSILLGLIYFNKLSENLGDILYLFIIILIDIGYGVYVNSGFYTWMNDIIGTASVYFNLSEIGGYNQIINNPNLTVSIAACYLGAIIAIIVTISLMKKMMYADLILDSVFILILPMYFKLEPNYIYFIMLLTGIIFSSIWKNTGRYAKKNANDKYSIEKKNITYNYSYKTHLYSFIQIFIPMILVFLLLYIIIPKDTYSLSNKKSSMKEKSDEFVETLITSGISGFFNRYDSKGGTSSGKLGGINSIRLDYQPDLNLTYVPYNFEPVYIRSYIGGIYRPYENRWSNADTALLNRNEFEVLKTQYNNHEKYSAKGKMLVKNLDAEKGEYALYYSDKEENIKVLDSADRIFYPYFNEADVVNTATLSAIEKQYWLTVSNDNIPSIVKTLEKINIPADSSPYEKAMYIKNYYYQNIPYTLRAGITPYRKDFVNYFLDSQKKGYCVHFATAGTLMLRYLGVPARYVEGYVYDYSETSSIVIHDDYDIKEYYNGYSKVDNSKVISVDLTDANAHAWIEIYIDGIGWTPVELTPPSSDTETNNNINFTNFMDIFSFNELQSDSSATEKTFNIKSETVRKIVCIIVFICIIIIIVPVILIKVFDTYRYAKADINTRLIYKYHKFLARISKKNSTINSKHNYRDVLSSTTFNSIEDINKTISILEKAGFSNKSITQDEFDFCIHVLNKIKK